MEFEGMLFWRSVLLLVSPLKTFIQTISFYQLILNTSQRENLLYFWAQIVGDD